MALNKQNVSVPFGQGIDTKTDPRQTVPGKLEVLQNSKFTQGLELSKRNGYSLLTTTTTAIGKSIAAYQSEAVAFDRYSLQSYNAAGATSANKGFSQPIDVSENFLIQPVPDGVSTSAIGNPPDMAIHSNGYIIYTFNGNQFMVVDKTTKQVIVQQTTVLSTAIAIRPFVLGNYFILLYVDTNTNNLKYTAIPASAPNTMNAAVNILTTAGAPVGFDAVLSADSSKLIFAVTKSTGDVGVQSLDTSLALSALTTITTGGAAQTIAVWLDTVPATPTLWVAWYEPTTSNLRYSVLSSANFATTILASTVIVNSAVLTYVTGISIGGVNGLSVIYYEKEQNLNVGASSTSSGNVIFYNSITSGGTIGSQNTLQSQGSIFTRVFQLNSDTSYNYIGIGYGAYITSVQPTYFLLSHRVYNAGFAANAPNIISTLAPGNALPHYTHNIASRVSYFPATISFLSTSKIQFSISKALEGFTVAATPYESFEYAILNCIIDFNNGDSYQFQEGASVLNITGGFLASYDGVAPVENNFFLAPEYVGTAQANTGGAAMTVGDYSYVAIYRWIDNKGKTHRSTPSLASAITITGMNNSVVVTVSNLPFTQKTDGSVFVDIYRTTASGSIYYRCTNFPYSADITSARNTASVTFTDTVSDTIQRAREILYTNGGVISNDTPPPISGMTLYKSRLFVIDAEDRNLLWFSKQILETTPVEMSANFTYAVDQRFGDCTALAVLDDKLIIFKSNAIFYLTGTGPDNTGNNNDFSDAYFVSSNAGCVDPRSIVVMQDGLMFKSNKGIYLLDRGLNAIYIGADVESYNSSHITGSALIPNSTQIQFTLDDGVTCLMYDYFYKQWGTFLNHNAAAATVYSSLFTYIDPTGHIFVESPGSYSDNGTAIMQSLSTAWMSLAGLQGFQRLYRLYLLTKYISPHLISVGIAYDFDPTIVQTITLDATTLASQIGSTAPGQWRINIDKQKCQAIQVTITEQIDPANPTPGAGLSIEALGLLVGAKLSYPKLPAIQAATS